MRLILTFSHINQILPIDIILIEIMIEKSIKNKEILRTYNSKI